MAAKAEVENYRITPEQGEFQQKYGALKKIEALLKNKTLAEQQRMMSLKQLWQELSSEFQNLGSQTPEQPLEELEGMGEEGIEPATDKPWYSINY